MKMKCLPILAIILSVTAAYGQECDYFPTFDMMSVVRTSDEFPVQTDKGKTLSLVDFYGTEIHSIIEELGSPDYTAALSYYACDPGLWIYELASALDLYSEKEIPVKVYEWSKYSLYVFCVRKGKDFQHPYGVSREMSPYMSSYRYGSLPLERWLAANSGDRGWFVLSWRIENTGNPMALDRVERFAYSNTRSKFNLEGYYAPDFVDGVLRFDSYADFYYRNLDLSYFLPKEYKGKTLSEFVGMSYDEFSGVAGQPLAEVDTIRGEIVYESTHVIWPLEQILDPRWYPHIKLCSYERNDFRLLVWFINQYGTWRVLYADVAPIYLFYIEY